MADEQVTRTEAKKEYFPPKVVHSEKLTMRATACALADATCTTGGNPGPIQS